MTFQMLQMPHILGLFIPSLINSSPCMNPPHQDCQKIPLTQIIGERKKVLL